MPLRIFSGYGDKKLPKVSLSCHVISQLICVFIEAKRLNSCPKLLTNGQHFPTTRLGVLGLGSKIKFTTKPQHNKA